MDWPFGYSVTSDLSSLTVLPLSIQKIVTELSTEYIVTTIY